MVGKDSLKVNWFSSNETLSCKAKVSAASARIALRRLASPIELKEKM